MDAKKFPTKRCKVALSAEWQSHDICTGFSHWGIVFWKRSNLVLKNDCPWVLFLVLTEFIKQSRLVRISGYSECLKSELVWISDSSVLFHFQTVWISDSVWNPTKTFRFQTFTVFKMSGIQTEGTCSYFDNLLFIFGTLTTVWNSNTKIGCQAILWKVLNLNQSSVLRCKGVFEVWTHKFGFQAFTVQGMSEIRTFGFRRF